MFTAGFHPSRLEGHRDEIQVMLGQLPDQFQKSKGGGWSFLNAYNDKDGHQWTGFHRIVEKLFMLGTAIGKVSLLFPRSEWKSLPGEMPYYVVDDSGE